jgi:hypothetical protein
MSYVNEVLQRVVRNTKISKEVVVEARARRDLIFQIAETYVGALNTVRSGSIAHGTLILKLDDADGSLVLDRKQYPEYTPDGEGEAPNELVKDVANYMRPLVQQVFPNVYVSINHKRAIYFRFRSPMDDEQGHDPTVDLVVSLSRDAGGLWIPNLNKEIWQPSDPAMHTSMVLDAKKETNNKITAIIRLAKLYAKQWSDPVLLSSFHLTALALETRGKDKSVVDGLIDLFRHAEKQLARYNSPDPAGISESIKIPEGRTREKLVSKLKKAADTLEEAISLESEGGTLNEISDALKPLFWNEEMSKILEESIYEEQRKQINSGLRTALGTTTSVSPLSPRPVINTRAYNDSVAPPVVKGALSGLCTSDFDKEAFESEYKILWKSVGENGITYTVVMDVLTYRTVTTTVKISQGGASVHVGGMGALRHVNGDGSLCLFYPLDPPERKWNTSKGLLALLDMVKVHLYKEVEFKRNGGHWLGEEVHEDE